ncbi:hypothetical protein LVB87_04850 [Lysobacter sp. KIS68-7]|uniref:hypothetical protein n=1 Tax=Lysobacter sp. KIS68-7 TaxID=2904252 RepID=UPI001E416C3A|nr:hypothetical protein [Lysobacter sp. KIS68-7]UHQ20489.1 hypothetical protein LVB87_04850 [Lysobacter sp. KIS68-7]
MPSNESVTLKLKPGAANGQGWTTTTASNGQQYSYKYTGGHNDNGSMKTKVGDGTATLNLTVDADNRYGLSNVTFQNDTYNQLTWSASPDMQSGTITDVNTQVETANYTTIAYDAQNGNATIPCDPMIGNDPRGPCAQIHHQQAGY